MSNDAIAQSNVSPSRVRTVIEYILVYLVVFASGGLLYQTAQDKFLIGIFGLCLGAAAVYVRNFSLAFIAYLSAFTLLLWWISIYTEGSLPITSVVGSIMQLTIAYLVLLIVRERFIGVYVNLIAALAAVSLVGFAIDQIPGLSGLYAFLPDRGQFYEGVAYAFGYHEHLTRNTSIFFEPAVYQAFLNLAIFLLLFCSPGLVTKRRMQYLALLIVALITCASTTGYLIFVLQLLVLVLRARRLDPRLVTVVVVGAMSFVVLFYDKVEEVVHDKVAHYLSGSSLEEGVTMRRKFDVLADMRIFSENLFGAGFRDYGEKFTSLSVGFIRPEEMSGSSNGVTKLLAVYGLPFGMFVFGSMLVFFFRYVDDFILRLTAIALVGMYFWAETLVLRPLPLMLIASTFVFSRTIAHSETPSLRVNGRL